MEQVASDQLTALGHPQRMAVFRLLVRRYPDDVPAGEIAAALDLKPNTASVYLSALMRAGLICQTRRGTSLLYRIDWDGVDGLIDYLFRDCCRGRPDLCRSSLSVPLKETQSMPDRKLNVLFICSGNSARSIFAESILRHEARNRFNAYSAGTAPYSELNPIAIEMLRDKGHDVSGLRSKHMSEFQAKGAPVMDFVFTVCDRAANEDCATWDGLPITAHWGVADPVRAEGTEAQKHLAFQQAYGQLRNRILAFAALPFDALDRAALQREVDEISQGEALG